MKSIFFYALLVFTVCTPHLSFAQEEPPIIQAVAARDLAKVKELVAKGEDINAENDWRRRPLDLAIETNQLDMVKFLIAQGAEGWENLEHAAENNNLDMVRFLLTQNYVVGDALVYACEHNNMEMVKVLVDAGSPVTISQKRKSGLFSKYYVSPIQFAVEHNNKEMIFLLLDKGVPLYHATSEAFTYKREDLLKELAERDKDYDAYLKQSIDNNMQSLAAYFVSKGAETRQVDDAGNTLVHTSALNGNEEMVRYCLEQLGLDLFAKNFKQETALMLAVASNKTNLVNYMLSKGAHANDLNAQGENALYYIRENNLEMFQVLVQNGADVSQPTQTNSTLLISAARAKNLDIVLFLLENGADVTIKDNLGHTAFQYIISPYDRNMELVELFLSKGADINTRDAEGGKSMMYYAIESESASRIRQLLGLGADINTRDNSGRRPSTNDADIIRLIIEAGADINALDDRDDSYLCGAIGEGDLELAHYLVNKGADVNVGCYFSEPPLVKAVEENNLILVRFLVENGANINAEGYFHKNVMEYAEEGGNAEIIAYLKSRGAMTKTDRTELYKRSMEMESSLRAALNQNDRASLAQLVKKCSDLVIQDRLVLQMAEFAGQQGDILLVELLVTHLKLNIQNPVNDLKQNLLMVATIHNQTSFVSYMLQKQVRTDLVDAQGKKAADYATSKEMKKIYKDAGL